jgi:glycosyltransferase involved in cell wall biosynthesis
MGNSAWLSRCGLVGFTQAIKRIKWCNAELELILKLRSRWGSCGASFRGTTMRLLGLIPEPPFHPRSWSGSSANFFGALRDEGLLADATNVQLHRPRERVEMLRVLSWPLERWKGRYRASVPRFRALTDIARVEIERARDITGVMQVGAWFSAGSVTALPCFSYHDANAAMGYRYYGRSLLTEPQQRDHLRWENDVYAKLRGIFVMSSWLASSFITDFGVPAKKLNVVGAGINTGALPRLSDRDFSLAKFLFVGKDFERKGGPFLLKAFAEVRRHVPHAELVIVGPSLKLDQEGVRCLGFLSHAEPEHVAQLNELFRSATAVVLPSVYEPFGISLLEGMAFGLPCIATDRCAMPEIVQHRKTGLIVTAEDVSSLAEAMLELARNPKDAEAMGSAGRRRLETDFTWGAVAKKIEVVLSDSFGM